MLFLVEPFYSVQIDDSFKCPGLEKNHRHVLLGTRYPVWKSETKYRTKIKVGRFPSSWEIDSPHPSVGMDQSLRPQRKNVGVLLFCFIPIPQISRLPYFQTQIRLSDSIHRSKTREFEATLFPGIPFQSFGELKPLDAWTTWRKRAWRHTKWSRNDS